MKPLPHGSFLRGPVAWLAACWFAGSLLTTASPAAVEPASLISKADAAAVIGQPVTHVVPIAESPDEDSGGQLAYATFHAGKVALIVSIIRFDSAAQAKAKLTKQFIMSQLDGDDTTVTEEKGIGERVFWSTTPRSAQYSVLKGSHVLAIGLGGGLASPPDSYHQSLRALIEKAAAKL